MNNTAIILLAHGARVPEWALPLLKVRDSVMAKAPDLRVELAFIEMMPPSLRECAEKLIAEGFCSIRIVPLLIARGGHLTRDVPKQIEDIQRVFPTVSFDLAPPVGEADAVVNAMAGHVLDTLLNGTKS